jgi:outer membrane protein OmpA-like peptidoglycan-associated protein
VACYGKERPLCVEHNEDCWQRNRNAAVVPERQGAAVGSLK